MRKNIFNELSSPQGIFKNENALLPEYVPDSLPHREGEVREIALSLKPAAEGRKPRNILIFGPTGTGKTCAIKFVFRELRDYSQRPHPIYINCWEFSTRHAVLSKLALSLGAFVPRRGVATDEIVERMVEMVRKEGRIPIVALDEMDRLLVGREERVLYDLLRAGENFDIWFGVVGVSNSKDFLAKLDRKLRSSFVQKEIEFRRYSPQELKDILTERAKLAFIPGSLSTHVIPLCAGYAAKRGGDARLAIQGLWMAGKVAEEEGASKVEVEHCRRAFERMPSREEERMVFLKPIQKEIVKLLETEMTSGELYNALSEKFGDTDRTIRNHLRELESLGLIEMRWKTDGGRTRIIRRRRS